MDDARLFDLGLRSLRASYALGARGAPENSLLELDGVTAAISPGAPDRSVVNGVVYDDPSALAAGLDEVALAYGSAGVRAWTVWVPEADLEAAQLLETAGHKLDATPTAMGMDLAELREPPGPEPTWTGDWDKLAEAGLVSDRAYGDPEGMWSSALGGMPPGGAHLYLAHSGGEPASFVLVHDHDGDCAFWFAATVPDTRGRGLAGGLLHRALTDARDRGCATSTTQATKMGAPVYERIGYRGLGTLQMWERREASG